MSYLLPPLFLHQIFSLRKIEVKYWQADDFVKTKASQQMIGICNIDLK